MDDLDFAWDWYRRNVAYQYDKTGCTLVLLSDSRMAVSIPDATPLDKVQSYFDIVLTGLIDRKTGFSLHGFAYANH